MCWNWDVEISPCPDTRSRLRSSMSRSLLLLELLPAVPPPAGRDQLTDRQRDSVTYALSANIQLNEMSTMRIHEINRFNLQNGARPDGNRAVQQHVPRIPNAPEIVVTLAGDQTSEQQYGGNDG
uniref:Uncharacterized protein n=1 Tax=Anopheles coluzzii TaxID=1518534 RepID=A0A8W7PC04_ANOCL